MDATHNSLSSQLSDLKQCEQEPLHFIGSVQSHGALICFTLPDRRIQACSENINDFVELTHSRVVSSKLDQIFEPTFADQIVRTAAQLSPKPNSGISLRYRAFEQNLSVYLYVTDQLYYLELESASTPDESDQWGDQASDQPSDLAVGQLLSDYFVQIRDSEDIQQVGLHVCRAVRSITGMDRVMLYRFISPQWHGEVIAEDRVANAHSYDQHRFPASDIPRMARDLYLRNSVRIIADVEAPISKVSPGINPLTKKPLDLSDSRLRAVSPIHLEYLRNMKVGASYSFAIIVKGELWGLIACHHFNPLLVGIEKRRACELLANAFAGRAPLLEQLKQQNERLSFDRHLRQVIEGLRLSHNPVLDLFKNSELVLDTFRATGLALVSADKTDFAGLCPAVAQLKNLADALRSKMAQENKTKIAIASLSQIFPEWKELSHIACGVLAVVVDDFEKGLVMIFRPEEIETITWSGDPRKQLDKKGFTGRINPRASFEAWEETIRHHSAAWSRFEVDGIGFIKEMIFDLLVSKQRLLQDLTTRKT